MGKEGRKSSKEKDSSSQSKTRAVLHWVDEDKVSIEVLGKINEEDRYVGAPTTMKVGSKYFKAIVTMISSDTEKLEAKEREMCEEIEGNKQSKLQEEALTLERRNRSGRNKNISSTGLATQSQLAAAFGEKVPPPAHIQKEAANLKKIEKASTKASELASVDVDLDLLSGARKQLFPRDDDDDSDKEVTGEGGIDSSPAVSEDDGDDFEDKEDENRDSDVGSDVIKEESTKLCCNGCMPLVQSVSKSVPEFLIELEKFITTSSASTGERYLEVLPIPEGVPKVEVSKGSKVYMTVHDKNEVKSECDGNPVKMVRECMIRLFGRSNIENVNLTAKGSRIGSLGIRQEVREAIRKFANRNKGPQYTALDSKLVTRAINRKKNQVRRSSKKSPLSPKKSSKQRSKSSKIVVTPRKQGSSTKKLTPVKLTPKKLTPMKPTPKKLTPKKTDMSWNIVSGDQSSGSNQQYPPQPYQHPYFYGQQHQQQNYSHPQPYIQQQDYQPQMYQPYYNHAYTSNDDQPHNQEANPTLTTL